MSGPIHIFSVRGRPVGFEPGRFGGALVAVERGFFPVSSTGYRSLAGHFGINGEADPAVISPEFLEALAVAQDRTCRALLARLRRTPRPTPDRLGNFISMSSEAEAALTEGFFARDDERAALWSGAFQRLSLINTDGRFQPAPAWTSDSCAEALAARRASLAFLRRLAAGELPPPPAGTHLAVRAYFELPPRSGGEPTFALPTRTADLPLDLPPAEDIDDEEAVGNDADEAFEAEADPAQMT